MHSYTCNIMYLVLKWNWQKVGLVKNTIFYSHITIYNVGIANESAAGNLRTNLRVMQRLSTNWQLITGAKPCHPLHGISRICSHADAAFQ